MNIKSLYSAVALSSIGILEAATTSYTITIPSSGNYTLTDVRGRELNISFNVPKFDPSQGTLTSVTVQMANAYLLNATATTQSGTGITQGGPLHWIGTYSWLADVAFGWSGPGLNLASSQTFSQNTPFTSSVFPIQMSATTGVQTMTGSQTVPVSEILNWVGNGTTQLNFHAQFRGLNPILYGQLIDGGFFTIPNNVNNASMSLHAISQGILTYEFVPNSVVPEPQSPLLAVIPWIGMCLVRRRGNGNGISLRPVVCRSAL